MIIKYYTHNPENFKMRTMQVGNHCVGIRMLEVTLENQEELNLLLSEKGTIWAQKNLRFSPKKKTFPDITEGTTEDWSDVK